MKEKGNRDNVDYSCRYGYVKIKHRRFYCLEQNPVVLAWVLFIRKETLSPGFKLESNNLLRWLYWWYVYNYHYYRNNFKILISFIQYKLHLKNIKLDLKLPFYGQLSMQVHKGYKIFDLHRGIVKKVFNDDVDEAAISAEILQLQNVSQIDFAPSIRRWSIKERWYEEDYIQGYIEAGRPPGSEKLLDRFYTHINPCLEKIMFFQTPTIKNSLEYLNEITMSLSATELYSFKQDSEKATRILDFINSIVEKLQSESNYSVNLMFSHGDFCPENMIMTNNGLHIFDWESAIHRSALFDFYSYFFYRSVEHDIPVDKIVLEVNTALPFLISGLSIKANNISNSILSSQKVYRWFYYLERVSMLVVRTMTDKNLDIMEVICRSIDAFNSYEETLAGNPELSLRNVSCTSKIIA